MGSTNGIRVICQRLRIHWFPPAFTPGLADRFTRVICRRWAEVHRSVPLWLLRKSCNCSGAFKQVHISAHVSLIKCIAGASISIDQVTQPTAKNRPGARRFCGNGSTIVWIRTRPVRGLTASKRKPSTFGRFGWCTSPPVICRSPRGTPRLMRGWQPYEVVKNAFL